MTRRRHLLLAGAALTTPRAFAADAGISPGEILIGQSAVLSGPLGVSVQGYTAGARLALDEANSRGGIAGRQVTLVSMDDGLVPDRAVANYKTLLTERGVFAFFGGVGSGTIAAAVPVLTESRAPLIGNFAVSDAVREKAAGHAYFVRATYSREAGRLVQHLATIGIQRIAVAHLDNPGGLEVLTLVKAAAQQHPGTTVVASAAVKNDGSNAVVAGQALAAAEPQTVLLFLAGPPVAQLMKAIHTGGASVTFYGMSVVAGDLVAKDMAGKLRSLATSQVVPYPWADADATTRRFRERCAQAQVPVAYHTFEGYLNGLVLLEALRQAGRTPNRASLHEAVRNLRARIGDVEIDFTGGQHTGSRFVELVHVTADGRFLR
jgi:ABC-type branched-subunit amino acid transport system substrate-binding protein